MDTWLATIIYGSIIYFTYKANIQIAELKGKRISERPDDWPWVSWQIYLIREAIKPKSINMPLGMWLVIIYFALGIITYFIFEGIDLAGVGSAPIKTSKWHDYETLGVMFLETVTIFFIYKKKASGFYLSILVVSLYILFVLRSYAFPLPDTEITIANLINGLIFPILILRYMVINKRYFKSSIS
ncbi:MAG: hypothetical protein KJO81_09490 [Gammaproteobacteria bacterium]|nr:hypothetical protein [Gammaproteobacteria bacterium]